MYYTVIKHDGHLRTQGKCTKHKLFCSAHCEAWVRDEFTKLRENCGRTAGYSYEGDYYNEITFGQRTRIFTKYR